MTWNTCARATNADFEQFHGNQSECYGTQFRVGVRLREIGEWRNVPSSWSRKGDEALQELVDEALMEGG